MPSTFFGLTIAGSALNSFHVATNTVANNVSNVNTKGYCRQEAVHVAAAIKGGAALVHGVQMKNIVKKLEL